MPSAKAGSGGKKKGKKSKKALEQERLLLEEQRRKEEEAARQEELARQREKEAREQKEREEWDSLLEQSSAEFEKEQGDWLAQLEQQKRSVQEAIAVSCELEKWREYTECSYLPDASIEPAVNAFLAEFDQNTTSSSLDKLGGESSLKTDVDNACKVTKSLLFQHSRELSYADKPKNLYLEKIIKLYRMTQRKFDALSAHVLQSADHYWKETTENLPFYKEFELCKYFLWVNYTKNPRYKSFNFSTISVTLPKALTLFTIAMRIIEDNTDITLSFFTVRQQLKQRQTIIGPVISLGLFSVPEVPKVVDFWTMRQLISNDLQLSQIQYPFAKTDALMEPEEEQVKKEITPSVNSPTASNLNISVAQSAEEQLEAPASTQNAEIEIREDDPSVMVTYCIGPGLSINSSATVKSWDDETGVWSPDGIMDFDIDRATGTVKFKTIVFRHCALVQDSFIDFPIEDWQLYPSPGSEGGPPSARLVMHGKWLDAEIAITEQGACLLRPMNETLAPHFEKKYKLPNVLLQDLTRFGISFISPNSDETIQSEEDSCYDAIAHKCHKLSFKSHPDSSNFTYTIFQVFQDAAKVHNVVVNHALVILTKKRRISYVANPDNLETRSLEFQQRECVKKLMDEIAPSALPSPLFSLNVKLLLKEVRLLFKAGSTNE